MVIKSSDGLSIFFEAIGKGQPLILLHGFGNDHTMWIDTGWTKILSRSNLVIQLDFRGCGLSDKPLEIENYTLEKHLLDIDNIVEAVGGKDPVIWGWSLGATVALHYSARRKVKATIACGSYFGNVFNEDFVQNALGQMKDPVNITRISAFKKWPHVYPSEIINPFVIYTGTNDINIYQQLEDQRNEIEKANGKLLILNGVDHFGLVNDSSEVMKILGSLANI